MTGLQNGLENFDACTVKQVNKIIFSILYRVTGRLSARGTVQNKYSIFTFNRNIINYKDLQECSAAPIEERIAIFRWLSFCNIHPVIIPLSLFIYTFTYKLSNVENPVD